MRYLSPLRYPGGKARLAAFFARLKHAQDDDTISTYAEPFAGGVGAGLRLLVDGDVDKLLINDLNPGIAAFWRATINNSAEFCAKLRDTAATIGTWHEQREIYASGEGDDLTLGFAAFFLNRTNRSGFLGGRPIGGLNQDGAWKIDARWEPDRLCERVALVAGLADKITVTQLDALVFLAGLEAPTTTLVYVDPPYLAMGDRLYYNKFSDQQHVDLASTLSSAEFRWVLTYDAHDKVTNELYQGQRCAEFGIDYSATTRRVGKEYMVFSESLAIPDMQFTRLREGELLQAS